VALDGGKIEHQSMKLDLRLLTRTDFEAAKGEASFDLNDHVVGWDDVSDEHGNALPFNDENRAAVLAIPAVWSAATVALVRVSRGLPLEDAKA
jgi:hypothetical protein